MGRSHSHRKATQPRRVTAAERLRQEQHEERRREEIRARRRASKEETRTEIKT